MQAITKRLPLLLALAALLLVAAPASAKLYKYIDAQGNETYTNDPEAVPPDQRRSARPVELKKLPTEAPEPPVKVLAPKALETEETPPNPVAELLASIPVQIARKLVLDRQSGLVLLPDSLEQLEAGARPVLRVALVFLLVTAGLVLLVAFLRRTFRWDPHAINANPLFKMRGLLWGLSIFAGAGFAYVVWHAARLDWKKELELLWGSTGGAIVRGSADAGGVLRIALADEIVEVKNPVELMELHRRVVKAYEQALDAADADITYLEKLCAGKQEPRSIQDLTQRLFNMDSGLKLARRRESDVGTVRDAAETRGLLLGEDPREKAQSRLAAMQVRLEDAQRACTELAAKGNALRESLIRSGGEL